VKYFDATNDELEQAKAFFPKAGFLRKVVWKLTHYGALLPDCFFAKTSIALEWNPPVDNFRLRREVKVYNLVTRKYCIRTFDRKRMASCEKRFSALLRNIKADYPALKHDYETAYPELTSFAFWERYLEIR